MSSAVISVENLGKRYSLGAGGRSSERYTALRDVIAQKARTLFRRAGKTQVCSGGDSGQSDVVGLRSSFESPVSSSDFWALKDVSFDIKQGEVVGIIGRNGAGKSTLLKILSRITDPTEGRIKIKGRVASLLEVGTGFHPELTGRENIFLNGAILGMTRAEIRSKFDEIVAFAEVEKFLDTPVKRYSSGMYVRLAFAVAAYLEPEILIVDEVLAVGDAEFQKKCLGKMESVAHNDGRTVIFVSHHLQSVQRLCKSAILLQRGRVEIKGPTNVVLDHYMAGPETDGSDRGLPPLIQGESRIVAWRIKGQNDSSSFTCKSRSFIQFCITIRSSEIVEAAHLGFIIRNLAGDLLISANSKDNFQPAFRVHSGVNEIIISTRLPLKMGQYQLDLALADDNFKILDHWIAKPLLGISPNDNSILPPEWQGIINEEVTFQVKT